MNYEWAIIGAGAAGIAALGQLLELNVSASQIVWIDPRFNVGDLGQFWGEVDANTSVRLFLEFLNGYQAFAYETRLQDFPIDQLNPSGYCRLKEIVNPLMWITKQLRQRIATVEDSVNELKIEEGQWLILTAQKRYLHAKKVILATGAKPKTLPLAHPIKTISLYEALHPEKLKACVTEKDRVAVWGASHSAMIAIRNLIDLNVKEIFNFYLKPIRFAVPLENWILYDNTGLKAETAKWARANIIQSCLPQIKRFYSQPHSFDLHLPACTKAIQAIGFQPRNAIHIANAAIHHYDAHTGIIAPGLFGTGIAFPRQVTSPLGAIERNVGLWKFMHDLRRLMPIWLQYSL